MVVDVVVRGLSSAKSLYCSSARTPFSMHCRPLNARTVMPEPILPFGPSRVQSTAAAARGFARQSRAKLGKNDMGLLRYTRANARNHMQEEIVIGRCPTSPFMFCTSIFLHSPYHPSSTCPASPTQSAANAMARPLRAAAEIEERDMAQQLVARYIADDERVDIVVGDATSRLGMRALIHGVGS